MGFLSRLNPFAPAWAALAGAPQPAYGEPAPQPTPMDWTAFTQATGQPAAALPAPRAPRPMQAPAASPFQNLAGPAQTPLAALQSNTAQINPPGFSERVDMMAQSPLFNLGMSLLGNARNGGNWGQVAQDMQGFNSQRLQQQRMDRQEARENEQWSWARDERRQSNERRRLAQQYINSRPEAERAELRMIDPDQLGAYLQQQRQFGLQERQMDLQIQEMRDNRAYRGASLALDRQRLEQDRMLNSAASVLGREEAQRLGADISRLRGWSMIDNDMAALEEILGRNPAAFNNLLDADAEQALARIRDPQTRRDVQTIYSIATSMAREELRGQTPVSNIDLLSAVRGAPSPSSGASFARDWLNRAYQDRADLENYVQGAINYMQQPDGSRRTLFEPDPITGRNFYQGDTFRRYTQDGRSTFSDVRGQGRESEEAQSAGAALAARRERGGAGNVGGRPGTPRLLREPNTILERQIVSEYNTALERGQSDRARTLEVRLRRAGLIP